MKIGFIGLGIMGKPMARNLMKKGHTLVVSGHNKAVAAEFEKDGASVFDTPKEIAANSDIIITMLPNSPQVEEVVLGKDGVIEGAKKGSCVIDMSSIAPLSSRKIASELEKVGVDMLDAPVSGGEPKAIDGTISVMVGGKQEVFDKYKDVIGCMAASVVRTGDIGAGNATKLANQLIVAINIAAVSEALTLAAKDGVEPELVYKAIRGGLAGSTVLDANPSPGNKAGGLSNIVEKAMGSIAKSGTATISEVIGPAEKPTKHGLICACTPASDIVCGPSQVASGIGLQVFMTGRGTPYGLEIAPVIKVCSRNEMKSHWFDMIDISAGDVATGKKTIAEVGEEIFDFILDVASGIKQPYSDQYGFHNDMCIFNPAPIT